MAESDQSSSREKGIRMSLRGAPRQARYELRDVAIYRRFQTNSLVALCLATFRSHCPFPGLRYPLNGGFTQVAWRAGAIAPTSPVTPPILFRIDNLFVLCIRSKHAPAYSASCQRVSRPEFLAVKSLNFYFLLYFVRCFMAQLILIWLLRKAIMMKEVKQQSLIFSKFSYTF
jgi:hypothetical protein